MLIKENIDKYIDSRFDFNFIEKNKSNKDIAYYDSDNNVCEKINNVLDHFTKKYNENYSRFGVYCVSRFPNYHEALSLFNQRYFLDLSKVEIYTGYSNKRYYSFKNFVYSNDIIFKDLLKYFIIYEYHHYEYCCDTLSINFNKCLLNIDDFSEDEYFKKNNDTDNKTLIVPNIYTTLQWFIKNEKLTVINKGSYFMFFFNEDKKFHLARTKDNDVYFREKDFDYAIDMIFSRLLK